ncbi:FAD-binding oxidoreductase [Amycolatopsis pithecellobii]|uniref:FAD-binding protein n=1 Tax=Amycolatopsis pithecellobii TaxID=664692 RepID=A0A6N7Z6R5_9PSEU|nr:FAD-binding oxidoreductase [Amycolatopsis pithecellobii]MTD56691.1 FAD-binding protein [Amycolatopsis pithecellobii]
MSATSRTVMAWNRVHRRRHQVVAAPETADQLSVLGKGTTSLLPRAYGHSYGDTCLNADNTLLDTSVLNDVIAFDTETGVLRCQAGVTIGAIQRLAAGHGWRLPVSPSTQHVSVGGAVAHDVHGRNHPSAGTFGHHVQEFELLRTDGSRLLCGPAHNADLFSATVGGMGLTGLITAVELQLRRTDSNFVDVESTAFSDFPRFLAAFDAAAGTQENLTAWLDLNSRRGFRAVLEIGNETRAGRSEWPERRTMLRVPFDCPRWLVNDAAVRSFNKLYFRRGAGRSSTTVHVEKFLYQMDAVDNWNRLLGPAGFYQYHFVLPRKNVADGLPRLMHRIRESGNTSFLAILKQYGPMASPGLMSFPMEGVGGAFDFLNKGRRTLALFAELDEILLSLGGRVYLAKDSALTPDAFKAMYPQWVDFREFIDPAFSSSLWRRVTGAR